MKKFQPSKKELIKSIRYSEDKPVNSDSRTDKSRTFSMVRNNFLINHFPINERLVPELYALITECLENLEIENKEIFPFVYNDSKMNAQCFSGLDGRLILAISSSIVSALNKNELKFVIGHELGHYIFNHSIRSSNKNLELLIKDRAKEITADRVGLLCCLSTDSSIKAIIKILSGLDCSKINYDINSVLAEFKEIDASNLPIEEMYSTHPPLPIRLKALLLFAMSSAYLKFKGESEQDGLSQSSLDQKVKNILEEYLDSKCQEYINKNKNSFRFWAFSLVLLKDELFDKVEQKFMKELFGEKRVNKLINLINSNAKGDVIKICSKNCESSFLSYFRESPENSILQLSHFDQELKDKHLSKNGLYELLEFCPGLKSYLKAG